MPQKNLRILRAMPAIWALPDVLYYELIFTMVQQKRRYLAPCLLMRDLRVRTTAITASCRTEYSDYPGRFPGLVLPGRPRCPAMHIWINRFQSSRLAFCCTHPGPQALGIVAGYVKENKIKIRNFPFCRVHFYFRTDLLLTTDILKNEHIAIEEYGERRAIRRSDRRREDED